MILVGAIVIGLLAQPASFSQAADSQAAGPSGAQVSAPASGTEAALRRLVAGLASGSPDYGKLSPQFAEIVRRDLPMTHPIQINGRAEVGDFPRARLDGRRRL